MRYRESFLVPLRCASSVRRTTCPNSITERTFVMFVSQCGNASRNISWPVTISADAACEWANRQDRCSPGAPGPLGGSLPSIPYLTPPSCLLFIFFVPFYRRIIRSPASITVLFQIRKLPLSSWNRSCTVWLYLIVSRLNGTRLW